METIAELLDQYDAGSSVLREVVAGMSPEEIDAMPVAGRWSTRQVVCHIADCELAYSDRMTRVAAEDKPTLVQFDPDRYSARLAYGNRSMEQQLQLVESLRQHVSCILRRLKPEDFQRTGIHSVSGPVSLEVLLRQAVQHLPHHVQFIHEKRRAMANAG